MLDLIPDALDVLLMRLYTPEASARRYETKASRLYNRWLRLPQDQRLGKRGTRLIRMRAHYLRLAQSYRELALED